MKKYYIIGIILAVGLIGIFIGNNSKHLGGYLVSTVTNTNIVLNTTTTPVIAAGTNLQRLIIKNLGTGTGYCAFGTVATSTTGLVIESPAGATSTKTEADITDPNLLMKSINCLSTVQGTFSILKY